MRAFRAKTVFAVFSAVAVLVGIVPPVSAEPSPSGFDIMLGEDANRSNPVPLDGLTVSGDIFVFLLPENGPNRVRFYLNDPELSSRHFSQVNKPPWDLVGSDEDGNALPFDTTELADGLNTLTAVIFFRGGVSERVDIEFEVDNDVTVPSLELSPDSVSLDVDFGGSSIFHLDLTSTGGEPAEFTVETDEVWLSVSPTSGTSPSSLEVTVDASDLAAGTHASNVTATATGYEPAVAEVTVNVDAPPDPDPGCLLVPEEFGVVSLPFELVFGGDEEGLCDVNDVGTGFPRVDPPSNGEGYIQENLEIASGLLNVTTTAGLNHRAVNNLDNALSVGVPPFEGTLTVETSIVDPPAGTGNFEQAGIWFGNGEDDFVKLVVQSRSSPALEMLVEVGGSITASQTVAPSGLGSAGTVDLRLRMDPVALTAHGEYRLDGGAWQDVATFGVPADFFPDGEPEPDETNSFAGIMASHRNGPSPLVYAFDSFSLEQSETEAGLVFSPGAMTVDVDAGDSTSIEVGLSASDGAPVSFEVASDSSWVTVDPAVGVTPADLEVTVDASDLAEGTHTANVTATASGYESATVVVTANVSEPATESLLVVPDSVEVSLDAGGSEVVEFEVVASDGEVVSFGVVSDVGWLVPEGGVTPGAVEVLVDSDGLDPGSHVGVLTFSASGYEAAEVVVSLVVTDPDATCFMVPEEFGIVGLPFQLGFDGDAGGLCDVGFVGTGFLRVDPPSEGVGYVQENLLVASGDGELVVTTTAGLALANTQDNALSVGLSPPGNVLLVETTVLDPPLEGVEGSFAQAGVWFGNGEDDYVKLVVVARGNNLNIEMREDRNGVGNQQQFRGASVQLSVLGS